VDRLRPPTVFALAVASLAGLVAFTLHTVFPDVGAVSAFFDERVYYALLLGACALCALRALTGPHHRGAWGAIAVGVALYTAGELYWAVELAPLEQLRFPSFADALYLSYFPCVYAGLLLLFRSRIRPTRAVWLDGFTAAFAAGAVSAAVLVDVVLEATGGSLAVVATNLAYPTGDIVLLALLFGAVAIGGGQVERSTLLLAGALTLGSIADSIYLVQVARGTYVEGTPLDALWPASLLCIGLAAWCDGPRQTRGNADSRPLLIVPLVCGLAACGVLVASGWLDVNPVAVVLATATIGAVLVRLSLTFAENRRLLELTKGEALTDALTGLPNRRRLLRDLADACASLPYGRTWLLALFDLDGFKFYNDTFGHPAGDVLLFRLGRRLEQACLPHGRVYRLGGDEFCLLTDSSVDEAATLLDAAISGLSDYGEGFSITSSFGAVFLPDDADEPSAALRLADTRLYAQKSQRQSSRDRAHEALVQALYEREPEIARHLRHVVDLSRAVGLRLGLDGPAVEQLDRAALLHDIGKLAVPDEVLRKAGPLTAEERSFIHEHTVVGERILAATPTLRGVGAIVRATHERWDGGGYPDGLAGDAIPLAARVIAACDAYTAMREDRRYSAARSTAEAIAELRRCAGSQFDPLVVDALADVLATPIASDLRS
jgi:two-component system, cell cycle response regulator